MVCLFKYLLSTYSGTDSVLSDVNSPVPKWGLLGKLSFGHLNPGVSKLEILLVLPSILHFAELV